MLHNVNNKQVYRLNSGSSPPLQETPAIIRTNLVCSEITVHWLHFYHWQLRPMFIQSLMTSSGSQNITYVKRAIRKAHFKLNSHCKVIQGHPYWCRQKSRTVCCRNVQLMPTLFLKRTKIWQRENGKFVDFSVPTQVWRRLGEKRLWISTNDLYCQKLESLIYILCCWQYWSMFITFHAIIFKSWTLWF